MTFTVANPITTVWVQSIMNCCVIPTAQSVCSYCTVNFCRCSTDKPCTCTISYIRVHALYLDLEVYSNFATIQHAGVKVSPKD